MIQITLSAFLILALSSLSKSRWFVAMLYAGLAFFTHAVFGVLGAAHRRHGIFVGVDFRKRPPGWRRALPPAAASRHATRSSPQRVIVLIIVASAFVLRRRIRAIEVVT